MDTIEQAQFDTHLAKLTPGSRAAVAVSGGRDSTALLHLLSASSHKFKELTVLTVDHRLRAASAGEAKQVADLSNGLNLKHVVLEWSGSKPKSGIQEAARDARYDLMTEWCRSNGVGDLFLAHTEDDQAETILMRLVRGSGVDGLAAMAPVSRREGIRLLRPLLHVSRDRLTTYLKSRGLGWIDDPSNEDMGYARVRVRALLRDLSAQGLTFDRLARTAEHMRRARDALEHFGTVFWNENAVVHEAGYVTIERAALENAPSEIGLRALSQALRIVGAQHYRPRFEKLDALFGSIMNGEKISGRTLSGCIVRDDDAGRLIVSREMRAIDDAAIFIRADQQIKWDNRFVVELTTPSGTEGFDQTNSCRAYVIRPVGESGWRAIRDQVEIKLPKDVRLGLPALWQGDEMMAVPHLGFVNQGLSRLGLVFSARFLGLLDHES